MNKAARILPALFCLFIFACTAFGGMEPSPKGDLFQNIVLAVPNNLSQQKYLGLSGEGSFTIPIIKARVVIVEIFSMYCSLLPGRSAFPKRAVQQNPKQRKT